MNVAHGELYVAIGERESHVTHANWVATLAQILINKWQVELRSDKPEESHANTISTLEAKKRLGFSRTTP